MAAEESKEEREKSPVRLTLAKLRPRWMAGVPQVHTFVSPLRVDLLDSAARKRLHGYIQERLLSYHEDENGRPVLPPGPARSSATARSGSASPVRRPARGLVTLYSSTDTVTPTGLSALLVISAAGDVTIWGGDNFTERLFEAHLSELSIFFFENQARSNMFVLSLSSADTLDSQLPSVCCVVRKAHQWLTIFRRRGITPRVTV